MLRGKFKSYFADRKAPEGRTKDPAYFHDESETSRWIVIADADFVQNTFLDIHDSSQDNLGFVAKCVEWLLNPEDINAIRPRLR